jgi:F-type H+-transporting ATPase subunit epsilon
MADTLQFALVSPERKLASLEATQVQIPGMEGDFTAMPNHAPFLTTLRPGVVRVTATGEVSEFVVTGGFAEVSPTAASILAELAVPRAEATADMVAILATAAETELTEAPDDDTRRAASQRLRDVGALKAMLGL